VRYLHRQAVAGGSTYRLYGMDGMGRRCFLEVTHTGTNMRLINRGINTNFSGGTVLATFSHGIVVDLTMV